MTKQQWAECLTTAGEDLEALKFFPNTEGGRKSVLKLLSRIVPFGDREKLNWLVSALIDRIGTYDGTDQIRAVYCTRFKPWDGVEANVKPDSPMYLSGEQCEQNLIAEGQQWKQLAAAPPKNEHAREVKMLAEKKKL